MTTAMNTKFFVDMEDIYGAHNYHPLDVVITKAKGIWVWDVEGNKYLDFLSAYSAVNQGHCHPRIVKALIEQAKKVTLTSRAFRNDQWPLLAKELCDLTGYQMVLPMNSGAEAVETALKAARMWAYQKKGVPEDQAEVITCANNFHGRTITIISFSTEPLYRRDFGPFTPGFISVPYGDIEALKKPLLPIQRLFWSSPSRLRLELLFLPKDIFAERRKFVKKIMSSLLLMKFKQAWAGWGAGWLVSMKRCGRMWWSSGSPWGVVAMPSQPFCLIEKFWVCLHLVPMVLLSVGIP